MNPLVAVIIVNWNNYRETKECLISLQSIAYDNFVIYLVDNGSDDNSSQILAEEFLEIKLLSCEDNRGFSYGNNIALQFGLNQGVDFFLLLNNDTEVINIDFLKTLVAYCERNGKVGAVGPLIRLANGPIQRTIGYFPYVWNSIWYGMMKYPVASQLNPHKVTTLSGVCLLVRAQAVQEVGLMDETFFMYVEEHEWLYRFRLKGWQIRYLPIESIKHHHGLSANKISKQAYLLKRTNYIYYLTKHGFPGHAFATAALYIIYHLLRSLLPGKEQFPSFHEFWTEILIKWRLGRSRRKNS